MDPDVFISHSPQDRAIADRMCQFLESQDIKCWIAPRDLPPGEEPRDGVPRGIEACRTTILVFSAHANDSESVKREIEHAIQTHKVLIPFAVEKLDGAGMMNSQLKHRFSIDAQAPPVERHFDLLARILKPLTHKVVPKAAAANTISGTLPALTSVARRQGRDIPFLPFGSEAHALLQAAFNFNHIVVEGHPSVFQMRIENQGPYALHQVEVAVECRGLKTPLSWSRDEIRAAGSECHAFEMEPVRSGYYVMRVTIRCQEGAMLRGFVGSRSLRINETPTSDLIASMRNLLGTFVAPGTAAPAGAEESENLKELLEVELPELFEPMRLALDYEVSTAAHTSAHSDAPLRIPEDYLDRLSVGTILELVPVGIPAVVPYQEIRLAARPSFGIGRSHEESDFITWFWPRDEMHDVKTRRISKRHCSFTAGPDGIQIGNAATLGTTVFDGEEVPKAPGLILGSGGVLDLSGIYFLEVARFPSHCPAGPVIANLDRWAGPPPGPVPEVGGSVRFLSRTPHVLPQNSTWLLTDATFGTSRANAVLLEGDLAEIQGRFHYRHGVFWVESFAANGAVRIEGKEVRPGFIVPLAAGEMVQLGEKNFRVAVEI